MMSTEASFDEDVHDQATNNDSIINKVKSRVSNIFPSVANWFSSPGPTNNGSVRRRRESESDENSEQESSEDKVLPQSKRRKSDVTPSHHQGTPSGSNSRRLSMPVNATPADQLMRNRNLLSGQQQQMTSSPYDFGARNPSMTLMASPIQINDSDEEDDETDEVQLVQQEQDETESALKPVSKRKGIHETQYNVLRISNSGDRSTSEPPSSQSNNAQPGTSRGHRYGYGLQNEVIPELLETGFGKMNGNNNDEVASEMSESDFTQPQGASNRQNQGRMSGFLGNRNKSISASTGQLSFQAHLETEKSLFAEQRRQFNPSVYGSSWSLNSGSGSRFHRNFSPFYGGKTIYGGAAAYSRRDTRMQQTLRVPTMIRPSSRLSNASSNSSLASMDITNVSVAGSSNQQLSQQNATGLSNTSKRILELLNQCTSPLKDARKMGTGLNTSVRVPSLMNSGGFNRSTNSTRFNETDLNASRTVRLTQPKTPYSRPTAPLPPTSELQVPSISQLLQMKRLLNSTAQVKKLASQSKSTLNDASEYKLPGAEESSTNKYTNKVKEKTFAARNKPSPSDIAPVPVNLPNIQLPDMKNVPKIDITIPSGQNQGQSSFFKNLSSTTTTTTNTTTSNPKMTNNFNTLNFGSTPTTSNNNNKKSDSDVICLDDDDSDDMNDDDEEEVEENTSESTSNTANSSNDASSDSMQFKFSSPVPILSKQVPSVNVKSSDSSKNFKFSNPLSVGGQLEFKGDVSLAKKREMTPPKVILTELKKGSCLDALFGKKADESLPAGTPLGFGNQFKMAASQWECSACLIRNDNGSEKCVACGTSKSGTGVLNKKETPPLQIKDDGFANLVAAQKSKWSCPVCMSQNDQSADKCLACTEPKPGSVTAAAPVVAPKKPEPVAMDNSFKRLVEKQKANWECASCFTKNEPTRMKCACCEEAKPGSAPEKVPQFSFSSGTTGKFSFGVPKDVAATTTTTNKDLPQQSSSSFVFGSVKPAESGTTITKADTAPKPTFSFGVPNSATDSSVSSSTVNVNIKPAFSSGGFSFGAISNVTAKSEADTSTNNNINNNKKRPLDETDTGKAIPTLAAPGFTFGKTNEAQAKAFSSPAAPSLSTTNNTVSSSGGFSFQKPLNPSVTTSTATSTAAPTTFKDDSNQISSTATTNAITTPIFGSGISGIKPLDRSAFSMKPSSTAPDDANKSNNKNTLIFGAAKKDEGIKPTTGGFTFGQSSTLKPADTSSIFGAVASQATNNETGSKPSFSFMASAGDKSTENKPAATFGVFGNAGSTNTPPKSSGFAFGATTTDNKPSTEPSKSVFGSFGSPSASTTASNVQKTPIFGAISNTNATPSSSPFLFGGQATTTTNQAPPPAYNNNNLQQVAPPLSGTPSGFSTPTPSHSTNIFGSLNNSPSVFGQSVTPANQENKLPTFGSTNAFGGAQTQTQSSSSPFGGVTRSASSVNSPFGGSGTENNDEPNNKKLNTGFQFNATGPNTTSTTSTGASPFMFGGTPNLDNNNSKGAFNFSPQVKPTFNFTETPGLGSTTTATNVPYQFGVGSSSNPPPGVFAFGATPILEQPQNQTPPVFEFGASNINNNASNNPFAPGQSVGMQQRRKIKATRRIVR